MIPVISYLMLSSIPRSSNCFSTLSLHQTALTCFWLDDRKRGGQVFGWENHNQLNSLRIKEKRRLWISMGCLWITCEHCTRKLVVRAYVVHVGGKKITLKIVNQPLFPNRRLETDLNHICMFVYTLLVTGLKFGIYLWIFPTSWPLEVYSSITNHSTHHVWSRCA